MDDLCSAYLKHRGSSGHRTFRSDLNWGVLVESTYRRTIVFASKCTRFNRKQFTDDFGNSTDAILRCKHFYRRRIGVHVDQNARKITRTSSIEPRKLPDEYLMSVILSETSSHDCPDRLPALRLPPHPIRHDHLEPTTTLGAL